MTKRTGLLWVVVFALISLSILAGDLVSQAQTIPPPCVEEDCAYLPFVADMPTITPTPTATSTPTLSPTPVPARRLGAWVDDMNLTIKSIDQRPDLGSLPNSEYVFVVRDLFTTRDGSWDPSEEFGSVDFWARNAYLRPTFDDAGADHHIFGGMVNERTRQVTALVVPLQFWSDGFDKLGDPNYDEYVYQLTKLRSGWGNIVMFNSSYVPQRGESGPWCWTIRGARAEVVCGGGMPANLHISIFAVWQMVPAEPR